MELVFDCNRLAKDELTYELVIRGFEDVGTVESMRSCLRNVIELEHSGQSLTYPPYPLNCYDEFKIIENNIKEVISLIDQFNGDIKSSLYWKLTSKITHIVRRVDRTHPIEDT
ncbi:hypothetical protein HHI36_019698 [Cryptolaemus montrouzieri]|uniref:Uncharacterized protein n=1 Tax=Cryptolaemus montrouzieri TaxID=559131 RepID=A0ABD2N8U3_9CUCU